MAAQELLDQLRGGVAALEIPASDAQHTLAYEWLALLTKWNQHYNLTAIGAGEAVVQNLILDSLAAAKHLRGQSILDVGSGAGIPGTPLAIYCRDKHFTLVDSNGKKARFMEHCRLRLALKNMSVIKSRVETMRSEKPFDTIISRALGTLEAFVADSRHLAHTRTLWLVYKSHAAAQEPPELPPNRQNSINWQVESLDFLDSAHTHRLVGVTLQK